LQLVGVGQVCCLALEDLLDHCPLVFEDVGLHLWAALELTKEVAEDRLAAQTETTEGLSLLEDDLDDLL